MNLFCFQNLKVTLLPSSKTLNIVLLMNKNNNFFAEAMLTELEELFHWITQHIEINTVLISSDSDILGHGLSQEEWKNQSTKNLNDFVKRVQKFVYSLLFLPQTIIINIKDGASDISAELALGADLRIAHEGATLTFDHLKHGHVPASGGICLLGLMTNWNKSKNWVLSGHPIGTKELTESGLVHEVFAKDDESFISNFLSEINLQAPVQRIQAKRAFLEFLLTNIEKSAGTETSISLAGNSTNDWKEFIKASIEGRAPAFTDPKNISKVVQSKPEEKIQ